LDPQLFEDEDQLVGGPLQLGLSGPVLPQIPLIVARQAISPPVIPPVNGSASRPVRSRKRSRVAIEAGDEPTRRKRQKRTV
jgi:hypothetical protein